MRRGVLLAACLAMSSAGAEGLEFDAGADLRIREEMMDNVPGLPNGGLMRDARTKFRNHLRFRPRVWGELKGDAGWAGKWRVYTRLTDEFRWNVEPKNSANEWPGEMIVDNLFLEGKDVFDGFMDLKVGRQDLMGYCGLDHVFMDGTPGDGSRTVYTDMAAVKFHVDEDSSIDLFGLYNFDRDRDFRLGYDRTRTEGLAARFPGRGPDQDDWGYGAIWNSKLAKWLPYQVFAMQKQMRHVGELRNRTELAGVKLMPKWSETLSSSFEAMSEFNREWSGYADIGWKDAGDGIRPYAKLGYHFMSGEWDPMWARAVNDSEMFLYGSHNGVAWWTNMHYVKATAGLEFGAHHALSGNCGPMFAAERDRVGGGDGAFKGLLSQLRYDFPLWLADRNRGERFEMFGHVLAEFFNPGDYYETDKPAFFFRWQVELRF